MAAGNDQEQKNSGKGFAGLASMVSNVESEVGHATRDSQSSASTPTTTLAGTTSPTTSNGGASAQNAKPYQAPPQPTGGSSFGIWLLGIGVIIGLLWLVSESGDKTSSPSQVYTPGVEPPATVAPSPTLQQPVAQPLVPSRPSEERPQVGSGIVLSAAQIRYCLAEDIRLIGSKGVISEYNHSDVDRFNGMVADYNSRCGSFKYRNGDLERARLEIETYRTTLVMEGRVLFNHTQSDVSEINKKMEDAPPMSTIEENRLESPSKAINFPTPSEGFIVADWTWGSFRQRVSYLRLSVSMQKAAWQHYLDKVIPKIAEMEGKAAPEEQTNFISIVPKPGEIVSITGKFIIKTDAANIRNQPSAGESSPTLAEASRNEVLDVSGYSGDFFVVTNASGIRGFIHRSTGSYQKN